MRDANRAAVSLLIPISLSHSQGVSLPMPQGNIMLWLQLLLIAATLEGISFPESSAWVLDVESSVTEQPLVLGLMQGPGQGLWCH